MPQPTHNRQPGTGLGIHYGEKPPRSVLVGLCVPHTTARFQVGVAGGRRGDGQGAFWGDLVGPNPTDRGKNGVKRSLLVEADGGPLSVIIAGANVRDDKLLAATLDAVVLERPEATEETPQHLCLDKGYDNRPRAERSWKGEATWPTPDASAR